MLVTAPSVGTNVLAQERMAEPRLYGDSLWGPGRFTEKQYDAKGKVVVTIYTEYDPDFKLNVPVSEKDLSLQLPSGTLVHNHVQDADYTVQ